MEKLRMLIDINLLPKEYKAGDLKEGIMHYEKDFNVKIIPYDGSTLNTRGSIVKEPQILK